MSSILGKLELSVVRCDDLEDGRARLSLQYTVDKSQSLKEMETLMNDSERKAATALLNEGIRLVGEHFLFIQNPDRKPSLKLVE